MGRFDDILIVSDIDGTFLGKKSRVVPENVEAIEYFKSQGGHFTIATGRMEVDLRLIPLDLAALVNAPVIIANGACMYDLSRQTPILADYIDAERLTKAAQFIRERFPEIGLRVSTPRGFLTDMITPHLKLDFIGDIMDTVAVKPISEWREACDDWYKMVIRGDSDDLDLVRAAVEERFGDAFDYCKSGAKYYELLGRGCGKARMLTRLRDHLQGELGRPITVYACGDYENDISMLRAADVAACPANAIDAVKSICKMTLCDHDEGFIADLIRHI